MSLDPRRHLLAAISYRLHAAVRECPDDFADYRPVSDQRTPLELLRHLSHLLRIVLHTFDDQVEPVELEAVPWAEELDRFDALCVKVDRHLVAGTPYGRFSEERVLHGPLADALTHIGQLALLRRLAGHPVEPQSYLRAQVRAGRLGPDQDPPVPRK